MLIKLIRIQGTRFKVVFLWGKLSGFDCRMPFLHSGVPGERSDQVVQVRLFDDGAGRDRLAGGQAGHPGLCALLARGRAHQEPQEEQAHHPRPQREAGCGEFELQPPLVRFGGWLCNHRNDGGIHPT